MNLEQISSLYTSTCEQDALDVKKLAETLWSIHIRYIAHIGAPQMVEDAEGGYHPAVYPHHYVDGRFEPALSFEDLPINDEGVIVTVITLALVNMKPHIDLHVFIGGRITEAGELEFTLWPATGSRGAGITWTNDLNAFMVAIDNAVERYVRHQPHLGEPSLSAITKTFA